VTVRELDVVAVSVVEGGAAPGAAVALAARRDGAWRVAEGRAGTAATPGKEPIFDLASVTKPFVAVTAARLAARGAIDLAAPLSTHLPELEHTPSGAVPLIQFLAHRAGLDGHRPLFAPLVAKRPFERAAALREAAEARRADAQGEPPAIGFAPIYSDLGYVLVGASLERALGLPLDELVERELLRPLALDVHSARGWLRASSDFFSRVLPTETVAFRGGVVRGVVHDENAWALAGHGLAGQAGLFGTASAVARFGAVLLDALSGRAPDFLTSREFAPLVAERPGGTLRAGFDGKSAGLSAAGTTASHQTFGHLGFTGTSLWCDPHAERVSVLLSNRVCPSRDNLRIRAVRPLVHDALWAHGGGLV
jgi:CubicO group peptidase (beta-lactamase class C family)